MFSTLVAIGPWITSRITGIAKVPKASTTIWPGSLAVETVARVAPKMPSQTVGRNWPSTLPR